MRLEQDAYFVLKNVGRTPACALSIDTEWAIESPDGKLLHSDKERRRAGLTIAPADKHHQRLCRLPFDAPGQVGKIKTIVRYKGEATNRRSVLRPIRGRNSNIYAATSPAPPLPTKD
jgi:hypothetical protein